MYCSLMSYKNHGNHSQENWNYSSDSQNNWTDIDLVKNNWNFITVTTEILMPFLCLFGILGNILNFIVVFSRMKTQLDQIEKGASFCVLTMGLSDILFCIITLGAAFYQRQSIIHPERDLAFYFTMYGNYCQNVLLKTSTGITVITGLFRYVVTSKPLVTRRFFNPYYCMWAALFSFVFWVILYMPLLWRWEDTKVVCPEGVFWILNQGVWQKSRKFHFIFENLWTFWGFLLPIAILFYCNAGIILSPHFKLRRHQYTGSNRINASDDGDISISDNNQTAVTSATRQQRQSYNFISIILISIIVCFIVLVTPSEVIHMYLTFKSIDIDELAFTRDNVALYYVFISCNTLQAVNMSCNFALYCLVSQQFRSSIKQVFFFRFLNMKQDNSSFYVFHMSRISRKCENPA